MRSKLQATQPCRCAYVYAELAELAHAELAFFLLPRFMALFVLQAIAKRPSEFFVRLKRGGFKRSMICFVSRSRPLPQPPVFMIAFKVSRPVHWAFQFSARDRVSGDLISQ